MPEFKIVIKKSARRIELLEGDKLYRRYPIVLGSCPTGGKEIEGDGKTPEGEFYVFTKNPKSKYHLSLAVSYPSSEDAKRGLESGLISQGEFEEIIAAKETISKPPQKTALGGEIYIHGGGVDGDWTEGCIALADHDMSELFELGERGTKVEIYP